MNQTGVHTVLIFCITTLLFVEQFLIINLTISCKTCKLVIKLWQGKNELPTYDVSDDVLLKV